MNKNLSILIISIFVLLLSLYGANKLTIKSNMEEMLPLENKIFKASKDFDKYFDSQDQAIIIITANKDYLKTDYFHKSAVNYMEEINEILSNKQSINNIFYSIDMNDLEEYEWAYLDIKYYNQIDNAMDNNDFESIKAILKNIEDNKSNNSINYLKSKSNNHYMMVIKPNIDPKNFIKSTEIFYNTVNNSMNDLLKKPEYKKLKVGLTGGAFMQDYEADTIAFEGLFGTMIVTLLLILIIVILFFGGIKIPLLTMYPLILGAVSTSAVAFLIYNSLNMFSVSFALLLLGLGVDFAVHLIARYQEERNKGMSLFNSIKTAKKSTGSSIVVGAITTAIAFGSFSIAKFGAFKQMGIISSIGLILMCIIMLILVPVLISLFDKKTKKKLKIPNFLFFIEKYVAFIIKKPLVIILIIIISVISLIGAVMDSKMKTELSAVYPDNIPSLEWMNTIENDFDNSLDSLSIYVDNEQDLYSFINSMKDNKNIKHLDSILDFMPEDSDKKLEVLKKLDTLMNSTDSNLFSSYSIEPMDINNLPESIKSNFIGKSGKLRIDIIPNINIYNQKDYNILLNDVHSQLNRYPVGTPAIMNEVTQLVKDDMIKISIVCLIIVFLISWIAFRKLKYAVITLVPLLVTVYLTLGLLSIFNIEINVFSISAFPLIIGIGIDSGIHLLNRLLDKSTLTIPQKTMYTGKAIILTGLTTIIGFGSLSNINHPGMANLGITVALGMLLSVILTLTLIPIGYSFFNKK